MTERISGSTAVSSAWNVFKKNWKFIIPAVIATGVVYVVLQVLQTATQERIFASLVIALIATIVGIAISLAWSQIVLKLIRSSHSNWNDFKTDPKSWFPYFVARLISGLFMVAAMLVFGLPLLLVIGSAMAASIPLMIVGIILSIAGMVLFVWVAIRYMMISFISIDHPHMGGWSLMKESARLTKGHIVELFLFGLLLLLINIIGLIALVVGLLVSIPVSKIATGYVYEHLKKKGVKEDFIHNSESEVENLLENNSGKISSVFKKSTFRSVMAVLGILATIGSLAGGSIFIPLSSAESFGYDFGQLMIIVWGLWGVWYLFKISNKKKNK